MNTQHSFHTHTLSLSLFHTHTHTIKNNNINKKEKTDVRCGRMDEQEACEGVKRSLFEWGMNKHEKKGEEKKDEDGWTKNQRLIREVYKKGREKEKRSGSKLLMMMLKLMRRRLMLLRMRRMLLLLVVMKRGMMMMKMLMAEGFDELRLRLGAGMLERREGERGEMDGGARGRSMDEELGIDVMVMVMRMSIVLGGRVARVLGEVRAIGPDHPGKPRVGEVGVEAAGPFGLTVSFQISVFHRRPPLPGLTAKDIHRAWRDLLTDHLVWPAAPAGGDRPET
jgi:hypothetical protein